MVLEIEVLSEKKGSNPGGKCILSTINGNHKFYVKHCYNNRFCLKETSFRAFHQPFYEAITFEMAYLIGLSVTDYYVIDNRDKKTRFIKSGVKPDIGIQEVYYFANSYHELTKERNISLENDIVEKELLYLDLLQISDIVGRSQNYFLDVESGKITYLDLGCSFVNAHEGNIMFMKKHPKPLNKKEFNRFMKRLNEYLLRCNQGNFIKLAEFVNFPYFMKVPIIFSNGIYGMKSLSDLISQTEIEEVVNRIAAGIKENRFLEKNGDSHYLKKIQ